MIRIKKNRDVYKFYIEGQDHYFWRHELLKVGKIDKKVPKLFDLVDRKVYEKGDWEKSDDLYSKPPKPKASTTLTYTLVLEYIIHAATRTNGEY